MIYKIDNIQKDAYITTSNLKSYMIPAPIFEGLYHLGIKHGWNPATSERNMSALYFGENPRTGKNHLAIGQRWWFKKESLMKWKVAIEKGIAGYNFNRNTNPKVKSKFKDIDIRGHNFNIGEDMLDKLKQYPSGYFELLDIYKYACKFAADISSDPKNPVKGKDIFIIENAKYNSKGFIQFSKGKRRDVFSNTELVIVQSQLNHFLGLLESGDCQFDLIRMHVEFGDANVNQSLKSSIDEELEVFDYPGGQAFVFPMP